MPLDFLTCPSCRKNYYIESGIFGCPGSRSGEEHILRRTLPAGLELSDSLREVWSGETRRTFDLFHPLLSGCTLIGYDRYRRILDRITDRLLLLEGRDFEVTPLKEEVGLSSALGRTGRLWVKNETNNVTGSHKSRHLMATLLYLEALRELRGGGPKKVLAIYSCGNAALGAAAVVRAGGYELHAFVPEDVDPAVIAMLEERGTVVEKIFRSSTGEGDPCYLAFRKAINEQGWIPFACAGNDNWSNIEGGSTLGWEMLMQLLDRSQEIDSVVIQVGGGALARSVAQAFEEALQLGFIKALPRIHVCQPEGGFPFVRAYLLALAEIARRCRLSFDFSYNYSADPRTQLEKMLPFTYSGRDQIQAAADFVKSNFDAPAMQSFMIDMAGKAGHFMWPWDGAAPHSLAHGILDDFTYDWYYLLKALLRTGGRAEVLREETIRYAHDTAQSHTGIPVCPTGAAGLAGLMQLQASGVIDRNESVGLFFTGFDRSGTQ